MQPTHLTTENHQTQPHMVESCHLSDLNTPIYSNAVDEHNPSAVLTMLPKEATDPETVANTGVNGTVGYMPRQAVALNDPPQVKNIVQNGTHPQTTYSVVSASCKVDDSTVGSNATVGGPGIATTNSASYAGNYDPIEGEAAVGVRQLDVELECVHSQINADPSPPAKPPRDLPPVPPDVTVATEGVGRDL